MKLITIIHLPYKINALTDEAKPLTDEADALTDKPNTLTDKTKVLTDEFRFRSAFEWLASNRKCG